ncbi:hypothetical protein Moror_14495 [Moniliophthora roreri MCA 2997]|uniref:Uncharacterized protein n=1 Tax=Moniliophthora roreri (strain MCA 2997) TaxID=1381753 RepID=V2XKG7_MONRO|nr:hypothetical protein Moror_14495 [Moniliophthora roreri MCA 2997]
MPAAAFTAFEQQNRLSSKAVIDPGLDTQRVYLGHFMRQWFLTQSGGYGSMGGLRVSCLFNGPVIALYHSRPILWLNPRIGNRPDSSESIIGTLRVVLRAYRDDGSGEKCRYFMPRFIYWCLGRGVRGVALSEPL